MLFSCGSDIGLLFDLSLSTGWHKWDVNWEWQFEYGLFITWCYQVNNIKHDLLFSRDVSLTYGCTFHFSNFHVTLYLSELQSQVLPTDSHKRAALSGTPQRSNLLRLKNRKNMTLFVFYLKWVIFQTVWSVIEIWMLQCTVYWCFTEVLS